MQHTFNSAKGIRLFGLCLLVFPLLPSHVLCKIQTHLSHLLPTGGRVAFKNHNMTADDIAEGENEMNFKLPFAL